VSYERGICPVTERMYYEQALYTNVCHASIHQQDLQDVSGAFHKVWENMDELRANLGNRK
jgi:hypothetical protein